jgi:hypothetical protein
VESNQKIQNQQEQQQLRKNLKQQRQQVLRKNEKK